VRSLQADEKALFSRPRGLDIEKGTEHDEIVKGLRAHDIAGVTVYRGILGYGANRRIHKDERFSHDRPILISTVDTEEKLKAFAPILDHMVQQGLVVLSDVDVIKYTHDYKQTDRRQEARL
jgi:PII-like signaling protein